MTTAINPAFPTEWTLAEVLDHLGGIPPQRIRAMPVMGTATEEDVLQSKSRFGRICELVDGVLVEKTMGYIESMIAILLARRIGDFVEKRRLGIVLGEAGTLRILPTQVRIPDVCFISWGRFPQGRLPAEPIPAVAPDLAIEVLSPGNTAGEMQRKLRDYFQAGVRLVWYVDPPTRACRCYTSPDDSVSVREHEALDGGDVLPGFRLPLAELFAQGQGPGGP